MTRTATLASTTATIVFAIVGSILLTTAPVASAANTNSSLNATAQTTGDSFVVGTQKPPPASADSRASPHN